ncbi:hypothetical protein ANN_24207 [Periplaneta americana]|uniref:Uncharacterized protein n=1 Tax=Periplaneta americana TaxID=6978 RepID=A0ABQ8S2T7_PERAM|nr:hypothetical protein ANN_24207 [Periplaneta americana]
MAGLCEGGNEPAGSLEASKNLRSNFAHMGTESVCAGVYCGQHQLEFAKEFLGRTIHILEMKCSPNLAPSDLYLFPKLQLWIFRLSATRGPQFENHGCKPLAASPSVLTSSKTIKVAKGTDFDQTRATAGRLHERQVPARLGRGLAGHAPRRQAELLCWTGREQRAARDPQRPVRRLSTRLVPGTDGYSRSPSTAKIGLYQVIRFKVCHDSLYAVMWLADEPREFNLSTLQQRRITYVPEKLPSKYGVHSEEYVPKRTEFFYMPRHITYVPEKLPGKYGVHSEEYLPIRTVTPVVAGM